MLLFPFVLALGACAARVAGQYHDTCYTTRTKDPCRPTTSTVTHYTPCTSTSTVTDKTTITPTTVTSITTIFTTTTSTAPTSILTDTATTTITTVTSSTTTVSTTTTETDTQTNTATTTVPTSAKFTPIQSSLPGVSYEGKDGGSDPITRRQSLELGIANISIDALSADLLDPFQEFRWPWQIQCHHWRPWPKPCHTTTVTTTSSVTASTPYSTQTYTSTLTTTVVPSATTIVTTTVTSTSTAPVITTSTATETTTETTTSTTSLYAACATNNLGDTYEGQSPNSYGTASGQVTTFVQTDADDAYSCCASAFTYPSSSGIPIAFLWQYDNGGTGCLLSLLGNTCPANGQAGNPVGFGYANDGTNYVVGNTNCGEFTFARQAP